MSYKNPSAVYAMIIKDNKILLQKRKGEFAGFWDFAACGHVEENESMKEALVREIEEEISLNVKVEDLNFVTLIHSFYDDYGYSYYNGYFLVEKYQGSVRIKEEDEAEELRWFDLEQLPEQMYPDRKLAIKCYLEKIPYEEYGWK